MPHTDGEQLALARIYADAMLHLAQKRDEAEQFGKELQDFADAVAGNPELGAFVSSPEVDSESRRKVLERLLRGRASDSLVDSLQVLNRKDRIGLIGTVAEAYHLALEDLRGRVEVYVTTAVPLDDALRASITDLAGKCAGKKADLVERIDEALLGGLIMRIGDHKFDASVAARLRHLGVTMMERAAREIHEGRICVETVT